METLLLMKRGEYKNSNTFEITIIVQRIASIVCYSEPLVDTLK